MSNTPMQSYELCDKHPRAHTALETADRRTTLLKAITDVALITNLTPVTRRTNIAHQTYHLRYERSIRYHKEGL